MPIFKIIMTTQTEVVAENKDAAWEVWDDGAGEVTYESSEILDENDNPLEKRFT